LKLLFIDTETTGLNPRKNAVIQIAGFVDIDGQIKEEFNLSCRPFKGDLLTAKALQVVGKSVKDLEALPEPSEAYRSLIEMFASYIDKYNKLDKFYMVGQNASFDYDFMQRFFEKNNDYYFHAYVDYHKVDLIAITMILKLAGRLKGLENMKLRTLKQYFKIKSPDHDAYADIKVTREIFQIYLKAVAGAGLV